MSALQEIWRGLWLMMLLLFCSPAKRIRIIFNFSQLLDAYPLRCCNCYCRAAVLENIGFSAQKSIVMACNNIQVFICKLICFYSASVTCYCVLVVFCCWNIRFKVQLVQMVLQAFVLYEYPLPHMFLKALQYTISFS